MEFVHVRCEGNKCADYISKLGRVQGKQTIRVMVPTNELVKLLKADMQGVTGVTYLREINLYFNFFFLYNQKKKTLI